MKFYADQEEQKEFLAIQWRNHKFSFFYCLE